MNKIIVTTFILGITCFTNCDCDKVKKADLFIKKAQQLYDYFGNPIYDIFTGQPVTTDLPNAMFYNERSGEYFNPEFGSILPTYVGDIIQFASVVTNAVSALSDCQELSQSSPSQTKMPIDFTFPNGSTQTYTLLGSTPSINANNAAYGTGRFQIQGPGTLKVNTVQADFNKNVDEFNEDNNLTQIGVQTIVGGRLSSSRTIIQVESDDRIRDGFYEGIAQLELNDAPHEMAIFKNLGKQRFSELVARHLKSK